MRRNPVRIIFNLCGAKLSENNLNGTTCIYFKNGASRLTSNPEGVKTVSALKQGTFIAEIDKEKLGNIFFLKKM